MKTGADVGEETATAVHWTPFQDQVRPLDVYICPTEGDGGKEYAIFNGQYINMLLPLPGSAVLPLGSGGFGLVFTLTLLINPHLFAQM